MLRDGDDVCRHASSRRNAAHDNNYQNELLAKKCRV
jgi:hypothetical protein